jgi:hypothetical protein
MGLSQKTYHFSLRLNTRLSWFNYSQTLNSVTTNERTSQNVGLLFKTAYRMAGISVLVTIKVQSVFRFTKSNFETDALTYRRNFFSNYGPLNSNMKICTNNNQSNFASSWILLCVIKKNSAFGFELSVNNLLDNKIKTIILFGLFD